MAMGERKCVSRRVPSTELFSRSSSATGGKLKLDGNGGKVAACTPLPAMPLSPALRA